MFQQKPKIKNEHIISEMIKRKLDLEKLGFFLFPLFLCTNSVGLSMKWCLLKNVH